MTAYVELPRSSDPRDAERLEIDVIGFGSDPLIRIVERRAVDMTELGQLVLPLSVFRALSGFANLSAAIAAKTADQVIDREVRRAMRKALARILSTEDT